MSEKKMVTRSIAIGLAIASIILAAGLVGVFGFYMQTVKDRDNIIADKENQIISLISYVTTLQNQVNNLTDVLNLQKSSIWLNFGIVNIMSSEPACVEKAAFAGYVEVLVSSQYNVTVEVRYFAHGMNYENSIILGNDGTAVFPVLPSDILIYVSQTRSEDFVLSDPLYATVAIAYHY